MINPRRFELPISRTNFHGLKDVRAIQVRLYEHFRGTVVRHVENIDNITKTRLFKYTENFTTKKWKFSDKNSIFFFHISAQNIDCRLELSRRGGPNE